MPKNENKQDTDDKTVNHIKDIFKSQASVIKESSKWTKED